MRWLLVLTFETIYFKLSPLTPLRVPIWDHRHNRVHWEHPSNWDLIWYAMKGKPAKTRRCYCSLIWRCFWSKALFVSVLVSLSLSRAASALYICIFLICIFLICIFVYFNICISLLLSLSRATSACKERWKIEIRALWPPLMYLQTFICTYDLPTFNTICTHNISSI